MRRIPFRYFVLATSLLWLGSSSSAVVVTDTPSATQGVAFAQPLPEPREVVRPKKPDSEERFGTALPQAGLLVALVRWGLTTLGVFDISSRQVIPIISSKETG